MSLLHLSSLKMHPAVFVCLCVSVCVCVSVSVCVCVFVKLCKGLKCNNMLTRCVQGSIQSHTHTHTHTHTPTTHQQNFCNTWILSEKEQMSNTHTQTSRWRSVPRPLILYSISRIKEGCRPCRLHPVCVMGNDIMRLIWPHRVKRGGENWVKEGQRRGSPTGLN